MSEEKWKELVKEACPMTAAGCGYGRLFHRDYRQEKESAWREAILWHDSELERYKAAVKLVCEILSLLRKEIRRAKYASLEAKLAKAEERSRTMKITEIRYEKLVNLGNFSHAKGAVVITLGDGDSPIEAFAKARHLVKTQINEETERQEDLRSIPAREGR